MTQREGYIFSRTGGARFDGIFRLGFAIFFKMPIAMLALLVSVCGFLVFIGFADRFTEYRHSPAEQLQSARAALVMAHKMDSDIAMERRQKGMSPVSQADQFSPALEAKVARLQSEAAALRRPAAGDP